MTEDIIGVGPELLGTGVGLLGGKGITLLRDRDWVIRDKLLEHGGYICTAGKEAPQHMWLLSV